MNIEFDTTDTATTKACLNGKPLNNEDFIFVSNGTWFVKGSICWLEANCGHIGGLFVGNRLIEDEMDAKNKKMIIGDTEYLVGELCSWSEFNIYDKNRNLLMKAEALEE